MKIDTPFQSASASLQSQAGRQAVRSRVTPPVPVEQQTAILNAPLDSHKSSLLRIGLISGATSGGILGAASLPLMPHVIVNAGLAAGTGIVGGLAGAIAGNYAETTGEALGYGAGFGLVSGLAIGLLTTDVKGAIAGAAILGALSGAIGGYTSTHID